MAEQEIVELVAVCPGCKADKKIKMDMEDPETAMLLDFGKTKCKNCGQEFPLSGNIDHSRAQS